MSKESNLICDSNIYTVHGSTWEDKDFIGQIIDAERLKQIQQKRIDGPRESVFTERQKQIMETELRCSYALNDPCWGYIEGTGIRSKCIQIDCPRIYDTPGRKGCNPSVTKEDVREWTMDAKQKKLYGNPQTLRRYYKVDLVSDDERLSYYSDPEFTGRTFQHIPDELKNLQKGPRYQIIGYQWILGNHYGDETLVPIWGYVNPDEDLGKIKVSQYGATKTYEHVKVTDERASDKQTEKTKEDVVEEPLQEEVPDRTILQNYKSKIVDQVKYQYKLTEITEEEISRRSIGKKVSILTANPAETAYISGMFLQSGIRHSFSNDINVLNICSIDDIRSPMDGYTYILTSSVLDYNSGAGTEEVWRELCKRADLGELVISGREYFDILVQKGQRRWGCRTLHGVSHVVIEKEDLCLSSVPIDEKKIMLWDEGDYYSVIDSNTSDQMGVTTERFRTFLQKLIDAKEMDTMPERITGLAIRPTMDNGYCVYGIGHMKFKEY